ncbi:UTP10 [Lepeophtheirus salmonis]|uniref:HEAT repeat-containing protein 1 n=1 Tax=Lepeophtheirus salmonis TaxID=72036 RepID=A0A7R8CBC9_LEPSM|nr:UTP10 [Lepeophtheirus salmonis]CAF2759363.1 UTP10 [Lepeophtheirus salmonis]
MKRLEKENSSLFECFTQCKIPPGYTRAFGMNELLALRIPKNERCSVPPVSSCHAHYQSVLHKELSLHFITLPKKHFWHLYTTKSKIWPDFGELLWPNARHEYLPPTDTPKPAHIKDILPILGPYALLKDKCFFITLLPFYEYEIFARAVQILPEKNCPAYPHWLRSFKASCSPVSKQGILRHISGNDGFLKLMTESLLSYKPLGAKLAHFYASYVTLSLNTMDSLREGQLILLLKVIFAGLKSSEKEVEFTEKVSNRLVKIMNTITPCREVLSLIMVLYRTQGAKEKALRLLLKMEDVVTSIFSKDSTEEIDDALSYKSVVCDTYVMCLVSLVNEDDDLLVPTLELEKLLSIINEMLSSSWVPSVEAAKALAAKVSIVQIRMKALKKRGDQETSQSYFEALQEDFSGEVVDNIDLVTKVIGQSPQKFLLMQMEPLDLLNFTTNVMRLYPKNDGIISHCVHNFIALFESEHHMKLFEELKIDLRLLALPFFDDIKEELYQDSAVVVIGLLSFCNDKSDPVKSVNRILKFLNLIVSSKMTMEDEKCNRVEEWIVKPLKEGSRGINSQLLDHVFDEILKMGSFTESEFEKISNEFILFASKSDKKRFKNLFFRVKTFIRTWGIAQDYMYENILANIFSLPLSSDYGVSTNIVTKLLSEFLSYIEKCRHTNKRFISYNSHVFPRILASLSDLERTPETMGLCFDILNFVHSGKFKVISKNDNFLPLIGFILSHRAEIEADLGNLPYLMKEFKGKNEEQNLIALSKLCVDCDVHIFARLSLFLVNTPEISLVARFASKNLMNVSTIQDSFVSDSWSRIFDYFFHKMIAFLTQKNNECSNFFWNLMMSSQKMGYGLNTFVSSKILEVLENNIVLIEDQVTLFNQFIDLSGCLKVEGDTMMASPSLHLLLMPVKKMDENSLKEIELKWAKTHFLLECILRRRNLGPKGISLIKPYFVLLKHALFYDQSSSSDSYSQDLVLSGVLAIIECLSESELSTVDSINPELIVHCIRNSRIPNTKSTALLILAKSSACNPDYVLHNSIPIFTFMGNHFVKMDSRHSFDVACQAIEIIIPHIQKVCDSDSEKLRSTTVKIITTFADAADDLPSHRFKTFLHKLLVLLGENEYLWIFTMQLLSKTIYQKAKRAHEVQIKLMDLFESFNVLTQLETIIRIAVNTKQNTSKLRSILALKEEKDEDKAKFFASQLTEALSTYQGDKKKAIKKHPRELELLLEVAILNLEEVLKSSKDSKIHKHLVSQSEKVLESALNILPNEALIGLMKSLLASETDSVLHDIELLEPLLNISFNNPVDYNRQMALMAIRSAIKKYLSTLSGQHNLEASTLLCVIEILISIGPKAVPLLSGFMNWILKLLAIGSNEAVVLNSTILATQKVVEAFGGFLNPFYCKLIIATCSLDKDGNKHIKNLMLTLSSGIPTQSLINISLKCFQQLRDTPSSLDNLLEILKESLSNLSKKEAMTLCPPLMDFFTLAFRYRLENENNQVDMIESSVIETFLTLTLKLPLDDFKPLFYRVLNSPEETCHPVISKLIAHLSKRFIKKEVDGIEDKILVPSLDSEDEQTVAFALEGLETILTYNKAETVMGSNYEDNVNVILNHYEIEKPSDTMLERMNACVSVLANSMEDDSQWKYLHYQVLLNLRSTNVKIRKYILKLISEFVDSRGDSYMSVLPDAVPFLAETTEDDDKSIQKQTKNLLKKMENVFGQSIDNFFEM